VRSPLRLEGGDRTGIFLSDRTIYLEGDRASKGSSSDVEVNFLGLGGAIALVFFSAIVPFT